MIKEDIVLYVDSRFLSPYAMSVFVALLEKNIPFQIRKVNLASGENLRPDYARLSLTQRVPTLAHGNFHLSESSAIIEYLDELFPAPDHLIVYPKDVQFKAKARQIQAWIRSDFLSIRKERSTEIVFCQPSDKPLSEAAQIETAKLFAAADILIKDGTKNLFNDWCIADTDLALMLNRLVINGDEVPEKLAGFARYQWERQSVQQWVKQDHSFY
jgi:glutathione S-transferase